MGVFTNAFGIGVGQGAHVNQNEPEVTTYITGLTTPLSTAQTGRLNARIKSMKSRLGISLLSDILDVFYFLAGETEESTLKNIARNSNHLTYTSKPSFTAFKGWKGDKVSQFLNTNYNPSSANLYKQNDASMGGYVSESDSNTFVLSAPWGVINGSSKSYFLPAFSSAVAWTINGAGSTTNTAYKSTPDAAMYIQNRVLSTESYLYKNGNLYDTYTDQSTVTANGNVYLLARNTIGTGATALTNAGLSCWFAGKGLTENQISIINDEVEQYMVSIKNAFQVKIQVPTVIFTFDDGFAELTTLGRSIFDAVGKKCTCYIVPTRIGTSGYMTVDDLHTMHDSGYDLECHSYDHANFSTLTEAQIITNFQNANAFYIANNLPIPKHFAYPYGGTEIAAFNTVYRYRQTARWSTHTGVYKSGYITDLNRIGSIVELDGQWNTDRMITAIDDAKANNGLVVFLGHGIYETSIGESSYPTPVKASAIRSAIDYAISIGVEIKSIAEVFKNNN